MMHARKVIVVLFFFIATAPTEIYTLSLHDALPISIADPTRRAILARLASGEASVTELARLPRSEEHTSELQSHSDLVCRLLLEKKKASLVEMSLGAAIGCVTLTGSDIALLNLDVLM